MRGAALRISATLHRTEIAGRICFSTALAYAYRPPSWRTDSGWDWRIFAEMTGERSGNIRARQS